MSQVAGVGKPRVVGCRFASMAAGLAHHSAGAMSMIDESDAAKIWCDRATAMCVLHARCANSALTAAMVGDGVVVAKMTMASSTGRRAIAAACIYLRSVIFCSSEVVLRQGGGIVSHKDLNEIPPEVRETLTIVPCENHSQALRHALEATTTTATNNSV
ncbi:hypothetical protein BC828DRAFT_69791 [Blastocladiella britannica]|nr:hypothetical protein BC828DRAFT_69791 [Blastocladiella britannica]